jgi:hypothetical protein
MVGEALIYNFQIRNSQQQILSKPVVYGSNNSSEKSNITNSNDRIGIGLQLDAIQTIDKSSTSE